MPTAVKRAVASARQRLHVIAENLAAPIPATRAKKAGAGDSRFATTSGATDFSAKINLAARRRVTPFRAIDTR